MMMSEMQAQINTLKAQLVDLRSSSTTADTKLPGTKSNWSPYIQKPAIPSWQQQPSSPPNGSPNTTTTTTTTTTSSPIDLAKPEEKPTSENGI
jgi:hypothetical protein